MQPEILDVLYRLVGEHGWNWGMRAISSIANSAPTTRSKNCSGSISAVRGQNLTRFLNKCIVRNPRRRYSPHAGISYFIVSPGRSLPSAPNAERLRHLCAETAPASPPWNSLRQTSASGGFIRLRPRLARIGQWCRPLRPVRHIPQHAMQRADDLRPVADAVGRQALARQPGRRVRQLRQQRFCLPQFHRHALTPPPFVVCRQLPIALTLRHPSALIAIVLRSNKLQIALTNQPNNNIYERYMSAKTTYHFSLPKAGFSLRLHITRAPVP